MHGELTIELIDGTIIKGAGEANLDLAENALVVDTDAGTHIKFNWSHVSFYHVDPAGA